MKLKKNLNLSLDQFIKTRINNANILMEGLASLDNTFILPKAETHSTPSWFGFTVTLNKDTDRHAFIKYLDSHKIGTRLLFAGNLVKQPYFQDVEFRISGDLTNTNITMNKTLWLGIYPALGKEQLDYIAESFTSYFLS